MKPKHWLILVPVAGIALLLWLLATSGSPDPQAVPAAATHGDPPSEPAPQPTPRERARADLGEADSAPAAELAPAEKIATEPTHSALRVTVKAREADTPIDRARVVIARANGTRQSGFTDADGVAVFDPAPPPDSDVSAYAPGRVRDFGSVGTAEPGEAVEVTLSLAQGERLTGRVVDPDGRPLADVRVELDEGGSLGNTSSSSAGPILGTTETNTDGDFAFDGVPAAELVTLFVTHRGFAQFERTVRLAGGGADAPVEIRLAHGAKLAGTVRGPDLQPVPGARIYVAASDAVFLLEDPGRKVISTDSDQLRALSARTGEDGRFEVQGLLPGASYVALAIAPGIGRSERHAGIVAQAGGETVVVDLSLRRAVILVVRVVDNNDQRIEGASMLCFSGRRFRRIDPDAADGAFRIADLEPGELILDVDADGWVKERVTHTVETDDELTVRLSRGLSVTGVAIDDVGEPLPDARIRVMRPMGDAYRDLPDSGADTRTDADGRFEVGGLREGPHTILCWADGHDRGVLEPVVAGARDVRVVSLRHASVTVELELPHGATAPAKVEWNVRREGGGSGAELDWPADGRIERTLPPIPVTLVLSVEGYADIVYSLELAPGSARDLGQAKLGQGETVTGRIVDRAGAAVAGAEVTATPAWSFDGIVARTAADGRFRIPRLAPATYDVEVTAVGFLDAVIARDPRTDLTWNVTLARGVLVSGYVRGPGGVGVSDGVVRVGALGGDDADDRTEFGYPDNTGRYGVRVRPGKYRVEFEPEEGDPVLGCEVELVEGGSVTVDFDLTQ